MTPDEVHRDWRYRCARCGAPARLVEIGRTPRYAQDGDEVCVVYRTRYVYERACGCLEPVTCEMAQRCTCSVVDLWRRGCRCGGG